MARISKQIYVIQKFVSASSLLEAIKNERKGKIVEVCLTIADPNNGVRVAPTGFRLQPDGKEEIDYGS